MPKLGINIDHVATLRQLRKSTFPDVLLAAEICESSGADSIVVHLREDRRHIVDHDVFSLRCRIQTKLNLEMSVAPSIVAIACRVKPDQATLVPEKRLELTTEGGLDVYKLSARVGRAAEKLKKTGIDVSLFIEPDKRQIKAAHALGVGIIEIHTGGYANARSAKEVKNHLTKIKDAVVYADNLGLVVNAGHGLDYNNVCPVARMDNINELNIGYSIICHSIFVGLKMAVARMKKLVK